MVQEKVIEIITHQYQCPICERIFDSHDDAQTCLDKGRGSAKFSIGDIVTIGREFGWFDGDAGWVVEPEKAKDWIAQGRPMPNMKGSMTFYYVITAIDDDHRVRYHLFTKAMMEGTGYADGWNFDQGHYNMKKIKSPWKFLVEDSKGLIGRKSDRLM